MPWDPALGDSQILAIHAALLGTGEILLFGGDEHSQAQHAAGNIDHARLYDTSTGAVTSIPSPTTDVFCAGEAFLPDGRLLVAGGTETWGGEAGEHDHGAMGHFTGHRASWVYRPRARSWQRVADMRPQPGHEGTNEGGGRWYPTLITLANGQVLALAAHPSRTDTRHSNTTPERYSAGSNSWTLLTAQVVDSSYYSRVHLLPDGTVFFVSQIGSFHRRYDPITGIFTGASIPLAGDGIYTSGWDATSVMLPLLPGDTYSPRILACGGAQPLRINLAATSPAWQSAGTRQGAAAGRVRRHLSPVILPTGQVFLSGGVTVTDPENPVREGEIYTPGIDWATGTYTAPESWASVEPAQVTRNYHSVALLMPNGRVWTAGSSIRAQPGDPATFGEKRIEIYRPPYDGAAGRPQITGAPDNVSYGETFEMLTPRAGSIQRVALIRTGSITHAFDSDMRYVGVSFAQGAGDRLIVTAPPHGGIAPPGVYMLWIVDAAGLPCTQARFVRVGSQRCFTVTDRSTFSIHEVNALLATGPPATFPRALYVVLDGFLPDELGSPIVAPALSFTFESAAGSTVPGITASLRQVLFEDPTAPPDVTQRATFVFDVRFADATAFAGFAERRPVNVRARHGSHVCDAVVTLTQQPNPYMVDGPVSWLSVDVRVFQIRAGMTRAGVTHGGGDGSPQPFLTQLLAGFNAAPNDEYHPFLDITPDQQASGLELARQVNGQRVFNYAVAKVRYRATAVPANDVKVFFRSFNTVGTSLEYNPATAYRRAGTAANAISLLGVQGTALVSIPFFAAARIDTGTASMATQTDPVNRRTLNPAGAQEFIGYYGAWLDFNQTTPQFPLTVTGDGPFTNRLSIQQHVRGRHQCLVAEVFFEPDPIPFGATPGSSENLAQRNLAIVESTNPGSVATRTVQHTFEIKPSTLPQNLMAAVVQPIDLEGGSRYIGPDELVITWNDLPPDSRATLFIAGMDANEVLELAAARNNTPRLERVDDHTIACVVEDITFVPIPAGRTVNIPALLSVNLPEGVERGQQFRVVVQQYSGVTGRVVGAFELLIPVSTARVILPTEIRTLSVLRHIAEAIPAGDRWFPVFNRYLAEIEDRVAGLGGDPDAVEPSPDGTGRPPKDKDCDRWKLRWIIPAAVAALAVLVGVVDTDVVAPLAAAAAVLLIGALCEWIARCRPNTCDIMVSLLLGLAVGAGVLGLVRLLGADDDRLAKTLAVVGITVAILVVLALFLRCFPARWCRACDPRAVPIRRAEREPRVEPGPAGPRPAPVEEPGFRDRVERGELGAREHGAFGEQPHLDGTVETEQPG